MNTMTDNPEDFGRVRLDERKAPATATARCMASIQHAMQQQWPVSIAPARSEPPAELLPEPGHELRMIKAEALAKLLNCYVPDSTDGRFDTTALLGCSSKLARMDMAIMPDSRCPFRVFRDDEVAVFPVPTCGLLPVTYRSVNYTVAYLAIIVIQNDGPTDADLRIIDDWAAKTVAKGRSPLPLQGFARWLLNRRRILAKKVKTRAEKQMARLVNKRSEALSLILRLASADGNPSPARVKNLEKLFPLFGLDPSAVHAELHRSATGQSQPIGSRPQKGKGVINAAQLAAMEQSTRQAQEMLSQIFEEDETDSAPQPQPDSRAPLRQLLQRLVERQEWARQDFEDICQSMGMLPGDALENLNDWAYEAIDGPVAEDEDDKIAIDSDAAGALLSD